MEKITQIQNYYKNEDRNTVSCPIHFDAIILDLNMPIMDGTEACTFILDYYKRYIKKVQIYGNRDSKNSLKIKKNLEN